METFSGSRKSKESRRSKQRFSLFRSELNNFTSKSLGIFFAGRRAQQYSNFSASGSTFFTSLIAIFRETTISMFPLKVPCLRVSCLFLSKRGKYSFIGSLVLKR